MSVMAETSQSAMGPHFAVAAVGLALKARTSVIREALVVKTQAEGGGGLGEGGEGDGGGGLGDGGDGVGGGGDGLGGEGDGGGGLGDGGGGLGGGEGGGGEAVVSESHEQMHFRLTSHDPEEVVIVLK